MLGLGLGDGAIVVGGGGGRLGSNFFVEVLFMCAGCLLAVGGLWCASGCRCGCSHPRHGEFGGDGSFNEYLHLG
jgi:hypothetical protein